MKNWGVNDQDFDPDAPQLKTKEVKIVMSPEDLQNAKTSLLEKCDELVIMSSTLYDCASSKELYDAVITLRSAQKSLNHIHVKPIKVSEDVK